MTSDKLIDIDKSRNRLGTCQVANGYEVDRIARTVDFTEVFLGDDMNGVIDCGMLLNATLESSLPASLSHQLDFEPLTSPRSNVPFRFGRCPGPDLRHDAKQ